MRAPALERIDDFERAFDVARHAEVAGVNVQRVRQAQLVDCLRQRRDDLPRRDLPMHMLLVDVELALVELEGRDAAGVHHLHAHRLRRVDHCGHVIAHRVGARVLVQQLEEQLVVAEHHVRAVVEDGHVAHLHVRVARVAGHHRRLERRGVAHLGIAIAGRQRAGYARAARWQLERVARQRRRRKACAMVLGQQQPRKVHLAAADVRVQVDAAG